ncbi:IS5 family transposase [Streptomyces lavendulae]|uniref:IS5 family transposase n=1 Tax=Streptomyces lavendulae TaxID=1914 RepID=UPI0036EA0BE5
MEPRDQFLDPGPGLPGLGRQFPFVRVDWRDHRQVIDGILHRVRTGVPWRDLPERFGPWKTVYERHRLRSADGTWEHLLQQIQAPADAAGDVDWDVSVDSTSVRAHQHAAGARNDPPPAAAASRGATRRNTRPGLRGRAWSAGWRRAGPLAGRFTSKIHPSADGRCRPLSLLRVPRLGPARPRNKPDSVAADKAHSNRPCREYLRRRGIPHTIPEKADSRAARLRRGAHGGRPPGFDEDRYKKRNTVERAINKLKNHRAVATRYAFGPLRGEAAAREETRRRRGPPVLLRRGAR